MVVVVIIWRAKDKPQVINSWSGNGNTGDSVTGT